MSLIPPPGTKWLTKTYTGDGSFDRVIPLPFTPKCVIIIDKVDNVVTSEIWRGDNQQGFILWVQGGNTRVLGSAASPLDYAFTNNGFNVGKAHHWNNVANLAGHSYYLLAI